MVSFIGTLAALEYKTKTPEEVSLSRRSSIQTMPLQLHSNRAVTVFASIPLMKT